MAGCLAFFRKLENSTFNLGETWPDLGDTRKVAPISRHDIIQPLPWKNCKGWGMVYL
jgi:hypothetical protein